MTNASNTVRLARSVTHANGAVAESSHYVHTNSPEGQAKAYGEIMARTVIATDGGVERTMLDWPDASDCTCDDRDTRYCGACRGF